MRQPPGFTEAVFVGKIRQMPRICSGAFTIINLLSIDLLEHFEPLEPIEPLEPFQPLEPLEPFDPLEPFQPFELPLQCLSFT